MSEPSAAGCADERLGHLVALLFVSDAPLALETAARALDLPAAEVEALAACLAAQPPPGLLLQRQGGALQLATSPASAPYVRRLLGLPEAARLSKAALEVLALIAYRQPVTRAEIDAVRGVSSDRSVQTLLARGLVEEVGRRETAGRPALLGTGVQFLEYLGLRSLDELPPLEPPAEPGEPNEDAGADEAAPDAAQDDSESRNGRPGDA